MEKAGILNRRRPPLAPATVDCAPLPTEAFMAHLVFDPDEQSALRADAREHAITDPGVAYVLERLAAEGVDLEQCADWEDLRLQAGLPARDASSAA
ncbi:hypothetical protein CG723_30985 [Streptomyces sp. CB01635]|nr:hypothetical protein CG723_30985 [Streptomyces sp. CB01635]